MNALYISDSSTNVVFFPKIVETHIDNVLLKRKSIKRKNTESLYDISRSLFGNDDEQTT